MEVIKITENNETVSIKITINYNGPSKYAYAATTTKFFTYESNRVPPIEYPHSHTIGIANTLMDPQKIDSNWSVELMNPSDNALNYEVKIEWLQGRKLIYTWPQDEDAVKGSVPAHSIKLDLAGNSYYEF